MKKNTKKNALFMSDPVHYYGWRDFSQRSSFGNLREWGFGAIAYDPDINNYIEGSKRMKEFGIEIDKITTDDIKQFTAFPYEKIFRTKVRDIYYGSDDHWRVNLANKYGIDYFILNKKYVKVKSSLKTAFENDHYIVLAAKLN